MSDLFNELVDLAVAAGFRLLELPLFALLAAAAAALLVPWVALRFWSRKRPDSRWLTRARPWAIAYLILVASLLVDRKLSSLLLEVRDLRAEMVMHRAAVPAPASASEPARGAPPGTRPQPDAPSPSHRDETPAQAPAIAGALPDSELSSRVDWPAFRTGLRESFSVFETGSVSETPGIDYVWIRAQKPLEAVVHVAMIDLTDPKVGIVITPELTSKWLTSDFARQNHCAVAINGEAGNSPAPDCGLGNWVGNWVVLGKAVMLADTDKRPFLSFDRHNVARYSRAELVATSLGDDDYNVIWGRMDLLVDGKVTGYEKGLTPRNCIAINEAGTTLYLMIVDGRRPGYSRGLTLATCARILLLLGAREGMSCDQGGSACMYLGSRQGLVNRPSDGVGERPVYSHFGVTYQPSGDSPPR